MSASEAFQFSFNIAAIISSLILIIIVVINKKGR